MTDVHTPQQRSRNMAAIKARDNESTEKKLAGLFRINKITGWRRHNDNVVGKPDFIFRKQKIAVFVDGCFWHGCLKCRLIPASNSLFWKEKIKKNRLRDRKVNTLLRKVGWIVIRIKEHELKRFNNTFLDKFR